MLSTSHTLHIRFRTESSIAGRGGYMGSRWGVPRYAWTHRPAQDGCRGSAGVNLGFLAAIDRVLVSPRIPDKIGGTLVLTDVR